MSKKKKVRKLSNCHNCLHSYTFTCNKVVYDRYIYVCENYKDLDYDHRKSNVPVFIQLTLNIY